MVQRKRNVGLVLSGGGARGAYQAGVIKAVTEICLEMDISYPFSVVTGVSAGAINAAFWSAFSEDPLQAAQHLENMWKNLKTRNVFRTDLTSLGKIGFHFLADLSLSGLIGRKKIQSLLDTSPLQNFLEKNLPFSKISENIQEGFFESLAITAVDYTTSQSVSFVHSNGQDEGQVPMWYRRRRSSEMASINVSHIMASAAIPIFFPPVGIGNRYFGDGCLRNMAPLSSAIHLGADKLLVIGVQKPLSKEERMQRSSFRPTLARVFSVIINSIFFDATGLDVERMDRINRTLGAFPKSEDHGLPLRHIDYMWIQPTKDIANIAFEESESLPKSIRYLLGGVGSIEEASELVSYLLFEPSFSSRLLDLGFQDAMARKEEIISFFKPEW